jgi:hypothetical protein
MRQWLDAEVVVSRLFCGADAVGRHAFGNTVFAFEPDSLVMRLSRRDSI